MSPLLVLAAFQAAPFDPAKDPAYAKPVTVRLAMVPLRTVVAALEKESGQPLRASGAVDTLKATMLVKGLPAGRAMEALADALGLVWKRDGANVLLARPDGAATADADYRKAERADVEREGPRPPDSPNGTPRRGVRRTIRPSARVLTEATPGTAVYARFNPYLLAQETPNSAPPSRLDPALPQGEGDFAKAVLAWPKGTPPTDEAWTRPMNPPQLGPSPWSSGAYSLADLLAAWHAASGQPVVADAFRVPMEKAYFGPGSALDTLNALAGGNRLLMRVADGVVRLRHPGFWRLREQEVPESAWGAVEGAKPPTLDALAGFASRLTDAQVAAFRSREAPLSRHNLDAISDAYPALRLWSALPAAARQAVVAGRPVPLAAVPAVSRAYEFALREAPYYRLGDPAQALALRPNQLGLFGTASEKALSLRLGGERGGGVAYVLPL